MAVPLKLTVDAVSPPPVVLRERVPLNVPALLGVARRVTLQVAEVARVALLQESVLMAKTLAGVKEAAPRVTLPPELLVKVTVLVAVAPVFTVPIDTEPLGTLSLRVEVPLRLTDAVEARPPVVKGKPRLP